MSNKKYFISIFFFILIIFTNFIIISFYFISTPKFHSNNQNLTNKEIYGGYGLFKRYIGEGEFTEWSDITSINNWTTFQNSGNRVYGYYYNLCYPDVSTGDLFHNLSIYKDVTDTEQIDKSNFGLDIYYKHVFYTSPYFTSKLEFKTKIILNFELSDEYILYTNDKYIEYTLGYYYKTVYHNFSIASNFSITTIKNIYMSFNVWSNSSIIGEMRETDVKIYLNNETYYGWNPIITNISLSEADNMIETGETLYTYCIIINESNYINPLISYTFLISSEYTENNLTAEWYYPNLWLDEITFKYEGSYSILIYAYNDWGKPTSADLQYISVQDETFPQISYLNVRCYEYRDIPEELFYVYLGTDDQIVLFDFSDSDKTGDWEAIGTVNASQTQYSLTSTVRNGGIKSDFDHITPGIAYYTQNLTLILETRLTNNTVVIIINPNSYDGDYLLEVNDSYLNHWIEIQIPFYFFQEFNSIELIDSIGFYSAFNTFDLYKIKLANYHTTEFLVNFTEQNYETNETANLSIVLTERHQFNFSNTYSSYPIWENESESIYREYNYNCSVDYNSTQQNISETLAPNEFEWENESKSITKEYDYNCSVDYNSTQKNTNVLINSTFTGFNNQSNNIFYNTTSDFNSYNETNCTISQNNLTLREVNITFDFTNETIGNDPGGWDLTEPYQADIQVIAERSSHTKVVEIKSGTTAWTYMTDSFPATSSGQIEYWAMDDGNNSFYIQMLEAGVQIGRIEFGGGNIQWGYKDGGGWHQTVLISSFTAYQWYHFRIDFDCNTDIADIYIDGDLKGDDMHLEIKEGGSPDNCDGFQLQIGYPASSMYKWVNAFDHNWTGGYFINRSFYYHDQTFFNRCIWESNVLDLNASTYYYYYALNFSITTNENTSVYLQYRTSEDNETFTPYSGLEKSNTTIHEYNNRYIQIRVKLNTSNTLQTPYLLSLNFSFTNANTSGYLINYTQCIEFSFINNSFLTGIWIDSTSNSSDTRFWAYNFTSSEFEMNVTDYNNTLGYLNWLFNETHIKIRINDTRLSNFTIEFNITINISYWHYTNTILYDYIDLNTSDLYYYYNFTTNKSGLASLFWADSTDNATWSSYSIALIINEYHDQYLKIRIDLHTTDKFETSYFYNLTFYYRLDNITNYIINFTNYIAFQYINISFIKNFEINISSNQTFLETACHGIASGGDNFIGLWQENSSGVLDVSGSWVYTKYDNDSSWDIYDYNESDFFGGTAEWDPVSARLWLNATKSGTTNLLVRAESRLYDTEENINSNGSIQIYNWETSTYDEIDIIHYNQNEINTSYSLNTDYIENSNYSIIVKLIGIDMYDSDFGYNVSHINISFIGLYVNDSMISIYNFESLEFDNLTQSFVENIKYFNNSHIILNIYYSKIINFTVEYNITVSISYWYYTNITFYDYIDLDLATYYFYKNFTIFKTTNSSFNYALSNDNITFSSYTDSLVINAYKNRYIKLRIDLHTTDRFKTSYFYNLTFYYRLDNITMYHLKEIFYSNHSYIPLPILINHTIYLTNNYTSGTEINSSFSIYNYSSSSFENQSHVIQNLMHNLSLAQNDSIFVNTSIEIYDYNTFSITINRFYTEINYYDWVRFVSIEFDANLLTRNEFSTWFKFVNENCTLDIYFYNAENNTDYLQETLLKPSQSVSMYDSISVRYNQTWMNITNNNNYTKILFTFTLLEPMNFTHNELFYLKRVELITYLTYRLESESNRQRYDILTFDYEQETLLIVDVFGRDIYREVVNYSEYIDIYINIAELILTNDANRTIWFEFELGPYTSVSYAVPTNMSRIILIPVGDYYVNIRDNITIIEYRIVSISNANKTTIKYEERETIPVIPPDYPWWYTGNQLLDLILEAFFYIFGDGFIPWGLILIVAFVVFFMSYIFRYYQKRQKRKYEKKLARYKALRKSTRG